MTATEELRRMLDERGVEWMPSAFDPQHETFYSVENGVGFIVTEFPEIGRMSLACDMRITPSQAVEATLGRGKCRDIGYGMRFECSECHQTVGGETPNFCPKCGREVER